MTTAVPRHAFRTDNTAKDMAHGLNGPLRAHELPGDN